MQLPSDIIDLLLAECSDGLFNKTKLGSSYGQSRKYLITLFFLFSSLLAGTMLLFAKGCAVCYKKALNGNKELFVRASFPAFVLYLFFVSPVVYKLYTLWKYLQFPGYFFLTNTGILLIEQGSMDQFSWFSYKDLEYGSNTFVLINGEVKRVLRIIDKLGQIHDYASELFDPTKYPRISPILHANITKIPQGGSD